MATPDSQFSELLRGLTLKQRLFLQARQHTDTDYAAAVEVGVSNRNVPRWKQDERFKRAYDLALLVSHYEKRVSEAATPKEIFLDKDTINLIARGQAAEFTVFLPVAFRRLFSIADIGTDSDALAAIRIISSWFHIDTALLDKATMDKVQETILRWTTGHVGNKNGESDS